MKRQKIVFIGPAGGGDAPQNGASAKNYHLMKYFQKKGVNVISVDTENWRKNPFIFCKISLYYNTQSKSEIYYSN